MPAAPPGTSWGRWGRGRGFLGELCPAPVQARRAPPQAPQGQGARAGGPPRAGTMQTLEFCKESGALPRLHPHAESSGESLTGAQRPGQYLPPLPPLPQTLEGAPPCPPFQRRLALPHLPRDGFGHTEDRAESRTPSPVLRPLLVAAPLPPSVASKSRSPPPGRPWPICGFPQPARPQKGTQEGRTQLVWFKRYCLTLTAPR